MATAVLTRPEVVSVDTSIALPPAGHLEALYEPVLSLCKATLPGWQNLGSGDVEVRSLSLC